MITEIFKNWMRTEYFKDFDQNSFQELIDQIILMTFYRNWSEFWNSYETIKGYEFNFQKYFNPFVNIALFGELSFFKFVSSLGGRRLKVQKMKVFRIRQSIAHFD